MQEQKLLDDHLDWLEAESIYIIREVVAQCANPAMLFSGGKDSIVMFHLARKAFQFGEFSRLTRLFQIFDGVDLEFFVEDHRFPGAEPLNFEKLDHSFGNGAL